jgi:hypothetical protein
MHLGIPVLILFACPALAETPMTAAEFEAWSTGKTLTYSISGSLWGSEAHQAGRSTMNETDDGTCEPGRWFPRGDDICFAYQTAPGPYCWRFLRDGDQVLAHDADDDTSPLFSVTVSDAPLSCLPAVGV